MAGPKFTSFTLTYNTQNLVPASPISSRQALKIFNTDMTYTLYYGDSAVNATTGIPITAGNESDWLPGNGWYVFCANPSGSTCIAGEVG